MNNEKYTRSSSRRTFIAHAAVAGAASVVAPTLLLSRRALAAPLGRVVIMHTNDTHSRMEPFADGPNKGRAGVARRATLIKRWRQEEPNSLVVDAGDIFQGTPWFNEYKGAVDIRAMHAMTYDATSIGNHEFDAGVANLATQFALAPQLAALSANYALSDDCPLKGRVQPHKIYQFGDEKSPIKVGVFGLGVILDGLVNAKQHAGVSYTDPREAAKAQVALLREQGCHLVVALSHLGHGGYAGEVGDLDWPKDVAGVDYVVGGHTHTFLEKPVAIDHPSGWRTAVMQVGHSGLNLGVASFMVGASGKAALLSSAPHGVGGAAVLG